MKYVLALMLLSLSGCDMITRPAVYNQVEVTRPTSCIEGVTYFLFQSGTSLYVASPKIDPVTLKVQVCPKAQ